MSESGPRYAIYFSPPPASPLWNFGCSVLGVDAALGQDVAFAPAVEKISPNWPALTSEPRKYGFHATLKAPFRLLPTISEEELIEAVRTFAGGVAGCKLAGLKVAVLGRFVALVPAGDIGPLHALAAQVVDAFESFRAPLSEADRSRRLKSSLTRSQTYYLEKYGYPYVHDEFRFHMTLTGGLPLDTLATVRRQLAELHARTVRPGPVAIDGLSVFRQDNPTARFRMVARLPLR